MGERSNESAAAASLDLDELLESATEGIAKIDRDWTLTYLNRKARELVGPRGSTLGRNHWEAFPDVVYPESPWLEHYYRAMEEKVAGEFVAFYPEPLKMWLKIRAVPAAAGIIVYFDDVTEQKLAEIERDTTNAQLSQILQAISDGVFLIDRQWRIVFFNERAKQIAGVADVVGLHFWQAFPNMVYEGSPYTRFFYGAMDQGADGEFTADLPDPLKVIVQVLVRPVDLGILVVFRDITEQKRTNEVLIQTEKLAAVGRLSASIAHEINNPLESVTNLLYLARTSETVDDIHEYLDTAERELRRVSLISSQTLRFHKQSTRPTTVSCTDLFGEALSIYQGRLVNSHVQVEKRKRAQKNARCFEGEIRQVLSNLIGNAIDAMHPAGGRLILRSREGTNWKTGQEGLILTVADTGSGMTPAVAKKIFEAFYTTKGIGGTGLGLWVSKEIVERHRGFLRVRSKQKRGESGTVFALFLPFEAVQRS